MLVMAFGAPAEGQSNATTWCRSMTPTSAAASGKASSEVAAPAVASCGVRPTFGGSQLKLEVHFFDFDGDLYGKYLRVAFVNWIRPEEKFDNVDDLVKKMDEDCYNARFMLEGSQPPRSMGRTAFNQ